MYPYLAMEHKALTQQHKQRRVRAMSKQKRSRECYSTRNRAILYKCRKVFADKRPRIRGRFVRTLKVPTMVVPTMEVPTMEVSLLTDVPNFGFITLNKQLPMEIELQLEMLDVFTYGQIRGL
jgi:hypothetical protein